MYNTLMQVSRQHIFKLAQLLYCTILQLHRFFNCVLFSKEFLCSFYFLSNYFFYYQVSSDFVKPVKGQNSQRKENVHCMQLFCEMDHWNLVEFISSRSLAISSWCLLSFALESNFLGFEWQIGPRVIGVFSINSSLHGIQWEGHQSKTVWPSGKRWFC